jgi:HD superfamily phosphohydrolase
MVAESSLSRLQERVERATAHLCGRYKTPRRTHDRPKLIRDALWSFYNVGPEFLTLLDSPFLQRLRQIFQTALAYQTYPCALHTRFEHSLGVWHMAGRMLDALGNLGETISPLQRTEVLLAALLHDVSHGPFSHASEDIYGTNAIFNEIRREEKVLFADASASEIIAWCILHSTSFRGYWDILRESLHLDLSVDRIGSMIVGSSAKLPAEMRHLRDIINGPFDADKLDYISRDGYFTGLRLSVDTDRMLWGLRPWGKGTDEAGLAIYHTSASALEQVIFAKSQLYTQLYHHHKVRAACALIHRMVRRAIELEERIDGVELKDPANFCCLDEYDVLGAHYRDPLLNEIALRIRARSLPMRALVISRVCFDNMHEP